MTEEPQLSARGYLRLVAIGAAVGVPAALVAALFLALVHELESWLWHDLPDALGYSAPPWYLVIGLPAAGACIVVAARLLLPGDGGHEPLDGIGGKPTPLRHAPGIALAALGTLSFGAVLGPEGPLIALGSAVGLAATYVFKVGGKGRAVLGTAGSFSAISALFGGPIVAGVMMLEGAIGLGSAATAVLLPGFVAAAMGYLVFVGFDSWGGLDTQAIAVTGLPPYQGEHLVDLLVAVGVGVTAALVVVAVRRAARDAVRERRSRVGLAPLLIAGGLAVGVLAQTAEWLGADSQDVLFSGQSSVPVVVEEQSARIVLILLVAKGLAYAISLGCGFRGGPVFPAVFLGVALATLCVLAFDVSPTLAVAVGAAAGMAAMTRLLLTSMLFAALLVGPQGAAAVPAAVLAAASAWLVVQGLDRRAAAAAGPAPLP